MPTPPSSLDLDRSASAARSGRAELNQRFREHTSTGPALTAGDVDADWESAESVGDEAPGGDNPTPDQDVVDEIGKALGVEYDDDEELQGGDEITSGIAIAGSSIRPRPTTSTTGRTELRMQTVSSCQLPVQSAFCSTQL